MIKVGGKDIDVIYIADKEIVSMCIGTTEIWTSGNFKTQDNFTFVTADNKTFNVNK